MPQKNRKETTGMSVEWAINPEDVTASNPYTAALDAYESMRAPGSLATVFNIYDDKGDETVVDIAELAAGEYEGEATPAEVERAKKLLAIAQLDPTKLQREIESVIEHMPPESVVRICEGGGPEEICATLAVSVAKLDKIRKDRIRDLERSARDVIDNWEKGDLAAAVRNLSKLIDYKAPKKPA